MCFHSKEALDRYVKSQKARGRVKTAGIAQISNGGSFLDGYVVENVEDKREIARAAAALSKWHARRGFTLDLSDVNATRKEHGFDPVTIDELKLIDVDVGTIADSAEEDNHEIKEFMEQNGMVG
jgi:hypothetical protein